MVCPWFDSNLKDLCKFKSVLQKKNISSDRDLEKNSITKLNLKQVCNIITAKKRPLKKPYYYKLFSKSQNSYNDVALNKLSTE